MDSRFLQVGSIVLFCILLMAGFYILYPFLDVLLIAVILTYLVRPAKEKIKLKNETISTLLAEIAVLVPLLLFLTFTLIFLVNALVAQQAFKDILSQFQTIENTLLAITDRALQFLGIGETRLAEESLQLMTEKIEVLTQNITMTVVDWTFRLPYLVARLFLAAFLSFYLVRDGKGIKEALIKLAPSSNREKVAKLIAACDAVIYGVVVGYLSKAIITGFISVVVFYFLGIGNPVLMGVIVAAFDFVPLIGPWTVFLGLFLWYALQGELVYALQVFLICYVIISLIPELYIRPKVSGTISHVHPMVMLIGILGGIMTMGAIGVLAGPLILGVIVVTIKSYFLDMRIEREDIIDRILFSISQKIGRRKERPQKQEKPEKEPPDHTESEEETCE
ncbi:MAG: AI-2E family transporter [Theionarchaea archaeon]|nr:AI-2E family transporter [Theionarchaea archaeon]